MSKPVPYTDSMQSIWATIEDSLKAVHAQTDGLLSSGPKLEDVQKEIDPLSKEIAAEQETVHAEISSLKEVARVDIQKQVIAALDDHIKSQLQQEIASQVKAQFDVQIRAYIPVPMSKQVEENRAQIEKVKHSRVNEDARRENSSIQDTDLNESLKPVLMGNGEISSVYPADLLSLFAYDDESLSKLLDDYGLPKDGPMETSPNDPTIDLVRQAYGRLSHDELLLFLRIRTLPTSGTDAELASRLTHHDLHTYHFVGHNQGPSSPPSSPPPTLKSSSGFSIDIVADIMDQVGDWELAKAVGVPTSIQRPIDWARAAPIDHAMLAGHIPLIRSLDPANNPPTKVGVVAAVRFGYVHVLEFFLSHHHDMFLSLFSGDIIPIKASRHGRIGVLSWWKHGFQKHPDLIPPPKAGSISEAVDGASRNGQIVSLEWWLHSGLPFEYSDAALEHASAKNQVAVLEWWKQMSKKTGMPLKIGRVMDAASTAGHVPVLEWWAASQLDFKYDRYALHQASCHGRVDVLDWWLGSGLQLVFDQDVLTGATRHNRADVLEWWDKSGLPIQYRMCDIEEALEDAIGGGAQARAWWKRKGVDFHADDKVWMKLQNLN
ncbi:hypothetical protein PLEOSDRAFT_1104295 [Pleurotus ostreatus PC15]|uniref:SAP domain-containing protein n=1 Tax=Pleurotus ostreatus (strain PC15) TaxID=1137138 RepID=A0A067NHU9_PLEO1|nr:hypothetical protein PLEOSDRAFT_1104295 [Pleurotus ostreatus PC15]